MSEETEVKNIEWVKNKIDSEVLWTVNDREDPYFYVNVGLKMALDFLDQLDEPEVLTQEWIDKNVIHVRGLGDIFEAEVVENIIVPNQELPVVPKYVDDWITKYRDDFDLYPALKELDDNTLGWELTYHWYRTNTHKFVNAYLTGEYEVEDEQKYYVLDSEDIPLLQKTNNHTCKTTTGLSIYEDGRDNSRFEFTEQEIKDYDERYFAFAEPVEATELF